MPAPIPQPPPLEPEPSQLPDRANHSDPVETIPEPNYSGEAASSTQPRQPPRKSRLVRLVIPLLFLIASVAVGFGVATLIRNRSKEIPGNPRGTRMIVPLEPGTPKAPPLQKREPTPSQPVPAPDQSSNIKPAPTLADPLTPKTPSEAARKVLDRFLAAETLAERLPLMESRTPEPELAKSCLAGPLPAASNISIDVIENNAVGQVLDYYLHLDFAADGNRTNPQTILVRTRGSAEPKIVADPLLDSFGGRLAAYAATPSDKAETFQVIVWPLAACYDERVPNREKKLTLKILPRDNAKEIALAFFGRQSEIARMLENGTHSLSYGKAKACTVTFRWNTEENPAMPYLEAVAIKTQDWNP